MHLADTRGARLRSARVYLDGRRLRSAGTNAWSSTSGAGTTPSTGCAWSPAPSPGAGSSAASLPHLRQAPLILRRPLPRVLPGALLEPALSQPGLSLSFAIVVLFLPLAMHSVPYSFGREAGSDRGSPGSRSLRAPPRFAAPDPWSPGSRPSKGRSTVRPAYRHAAPPGLGTRCGRTWAGDIRVVLLRSGPEWDAARPMEEQSDCPPTRRSWTGSWTRLHRAGRAVADDPGSCTSSRPSRRARSRRCWPRSVE